MRRIATITCNWNGGPFVVPHLKMLRALGVDRSIVLQGTAPWPKSIAEYPEIGASHDGTATRLVEAGFDVRVARANNFCADLYNHGLELLSDCDVVFRLDCDMFMEPENGRRLMDFVRTTDHDLYALDFSKCTMTYHHDFDHGVMSGAEFDPIAVSPKKRYFDLLKYPAENACLINWPGFMVHHYRGWKGIESTPAWLAGEVPSKHGVWVRDILHRFGDNGGWYKTPDVIRKSIEAQ